MLAGVAAPWMLPWLGAAALPLLLAFAAVTRPQVRGFAPIDLVIRAAARARLTRCGVPWPETLLRSLLVAAAALAACRPWLRTGAEAGGSAAGTALVAGSGLRRIAIVAPPWAPDPRHDATLAVRAAITAVVEAAAGRPGGASDGRMPPSVDVMPLTAAAAPPRDPAERRLVVLADGVVPGPAEAARLVEGVERGGAILVCLGPASLAGAVRERLDGWLTPLIGGGVEGVASFEDAAIEAAPPLAAPLGLRAAAGADPGAFVTLPGPTVSAAALVDCPRGEILARTAPGGVPLLWSVRRGRGRVCVSALPLALPQRDAEATGGLGAWSDLAAWPVFVPFMEAVVEQASPGLRAPTAERPPRAAPRATAGRALSLAPALIALALLLTLADGWREAHGGSPGGRGAGWLRGGGRAAAVGCLAAMLAAWSAAAAPPAGVTGPRPAVAVVVDVSPSMDGPFGDALPGITRLEAVLAALRTDRGGGSPLARLERGHDVAVIGAAATADTVSRTGEDAAVAVDRLRCVAASTAASRLGDAVLGVLDGLPGPRPPRGVPAALVVVSDGVITAGATWSAAAAAAATRGVALVAVPVAGVSAADRDPPLPPGFRITAVVPPRLGRADEAIGITVEAEAATDDPVPIRLWLDRAATGAAAADGMLTPRPAGTAGATRLAGTLVVPPGSFAGERAWHASPVVVAGGGPAAARATVPLALTDVAIDVLMVEHGPRFEWRFLERLLAGDAAFAPRSVLLAAPQDAGGGPPATLPRTAVEWSRFDAVILGDVPGDGIADPAVDHRDRQAARPREGDRGGPAPVRPGESAASDTPRRTLPTAAAAILADSLAALGNAARRDGPGIAWLPGRLWRESGGDGPDWLPARPAAGGPDPSTPLRLRPVAAGRDAVWLPWLGADDPFAPEVFATCGSVVLGPTARVLAVAAGPASDGVPTRPAPAIVLDRIGGTPLLVHLCETWRWRTADPTRYRGSWRHTIARLAEPHLLGRLFSATLDVDPAAPLAGEAVRVVVQPTRSGIDLAGWSLEVRPADATGSGARAAGTLHPLGDGPTRGAGRPVVIDIGPLSPGGHELRLLPPAARGSSAADPVSPVHTLLVGEPLIERPGDAGGTAALEAATLGVGGAVVPPAQLEMLPAAVAGAVARVRGDGEEVGAAAPGAAPARAGPTASGSAGLVRTTAARDHVLVLLLLVALAAAWAPAPWFTRAVGNADARH